MHGRRADYLNPIPVGSRFVARARARVQTLPLLEGPASLPAVLRPHRSMGSEQRAQSAGQGRAGPNPKPTHGGRARRTSCAARTASSTRSPTWAGIRSTPTAPARARARRASSGTASPAACTCRPTLASASTAATPRRACCRRRALPFCRAFGVRALGAAAAGAMAATSACGGQHLGARPPRRARPCGVAQPLHAVH